ncbi:MAG: hypothetical protein H7843_14150 [Nitrospirota bacterium]
MAIREGFKGFIRNEDIDGFDKHPYEEEISSNSPNPDVRGVQLFKDCYGNHLPDTFDPKTDKLVYQHDSTECYISANNLSSYFINILYEAPSFEYFTSTSMKDKLKNIDELIARIIENYDIKRMDEDFMTGKSMSTFIVGDIGQGKSTFIKKIISLISKNGINDKDGNLLLPIYMNMEDYYDYGKEPLSSANDCSSGDPRTKKVLTRDFISDLFNTIRLVMLSKYRQQINLGDLQEYHHKNNDMLPLQDLINKLLKINVRLLVFIDNIDFYHCFYARYAFFDKYNKRQQDSVNNNIQWLINIFKKDTNLGNSGLNVVIAIREYVYDYMVRRRNPMTTAQNAKKIEIETPEASTVLYKRFKLMNDAMVEIEKVLHIQNTKGGQISEQQKRKQYEERQKHREEQMRLIKGSFNVEQGEADYKKPISVISKLGQHGHRSLVLFFSSLKIAYTEDILIRRFFQDEIAYLYILYYNNIYKRYTQKQAHFPNIFLVDCTVMQYDSRFSDAHAPHIHTYWIKYFILKYIVEKKNVRVKELLNVFKDIGKYEDHLVRHVIGSLCTQSEFRCIYIDYEIGEDYNNYKLIPTERGKLLVGNNIINIDVELCFSFEYLQTVIDDRWLSLPDGYSKYIYRTDFDYSYLYMTDNAYIDKAIVSIKEKAKCVLYFIKILIFTFDIEIKVCKTELYNIIKGMNAIPDFKKIERSVIKTVQDILSRLHRDDIKFINELENIRDAYGDNEVQLFNFFKKYYRN